MGRVWRKLPAGRVYRSVWRGSFAEFSKQINDLQLSAEEINVCYLAVIGLRNSEISALMNVYASTITRRMQTLSKKGVLFPLGDSEG